MKTGRKDLSANRCFSMRCLGSEKLTQKAMEGYLTEGRRLHSMFVCDLLFRFLRMLWAILIPSVKCSDPKAA